MSIQTSLAVSILIFTVLAVMIDRNLIQILDEMRQLRQLLRERLSLSEMERIRQHIPDDDDD